MSSLIANCTYKALYLKEMLYVANLTVYDDISFLSDTHQELSGNLTTLEEEAQSQNLSISECLSIHQNLNSTVKTTLEGLEYKWFTYFGLWYDDVNGHLNNSFRNLGFTYSEKFLFNEIRACGDAPTCLSQTIDNIYANYTNNENYLNNLMESHFNVIPVDLSDASTNVIEAMYEGINDIYNMYDNEVDCLKNAGLDVL